MIKNAVTNLQLNTKGMIPIEKNIVVIDEQGNRYEATYPKRAKGLVKSGRARFVDENTICLACPPKEILEDKNMSEFDTNQATPETQNTAPEAAPVLTMEYVLSHITQIVTQTQYLNSTIEKIGSIANLGPGEAYSPGDITGEAKAKALGDVVRSRETTNQQMLHLLEKMYDDLKPVKPSDDLLKMNQLADMLCRYPQEFAMETIRKATLQMFVKPGAEIVK